MKKIYFFFSGRVSGHTISKTEAAVHMRSLPTPKVYAATIGGENQLCLALTEGTQSEIVLLDMLNAARQMLYPSQEVATYLERECNEHNTLCVFGSSEAMLPCISLLEQRDVVCEVYTVI